jgi:hypothetical protein
MSLGDKGGAIGFLVGEENNGMACMFTMMNRARLCVGIEGVGIADRAYQQALAYAHERKQGKAIGKKGSESDPIIVHPDVKRNLMLMRSLTGAARSICYATAVAIDVSHRAADSKIRAAAVTRAALLTPMAKAFSTDIGNEVAALGVQVHGGMGFIEETGAAQYVRDARILTIYEGTNGVQANDLVMRKLATDGGAAARELLRELSSVVTAVNASNDPAFGATAERLREALDASDRASAWVLGQLSKSPNNALAGATPYLRLFASTLGGCLMAKEALAAAQDPGIAGGAARYVTLARFFAEHVAVQAAALEREVTGGADAVTGADTVLMS